MRTTMQASCLDCTRHGGEHLLIAWVKITFCSVAEREKWKGHLFLGSWPEIPERQFCLFQGHLALVFFLKLSAPNPTHAVFKSLSAPSSWSILQMLVLSSGQFIMVCRRALFCTGKWGVPAASNQPSAGPIALLGEGSPEPPHCKCAPKTSLLQMQILTTTYWFRDSGAGLSPLICVLTNCLGAC